MGYFANLYLVEVQRDGDSTVVETNIYRGGVDRTAYFTWGAGDRPGGFRSYAHDTLFSDAKLKLLPAYPRIEKYDSSEPFLLDASFEPKQRDDAVLFHIVLYQSYVPMRNREPFIQPGRASVFIDERIISLTYPVRGSGQLQFWVTPIRAGESLTDYDLTKITVPSVKNQRTAKVGFSIGLISGEWGSSY